MPLSDLLSLASTEHPGKQASLELALDHFTAHFRLWLLIPGLENRLDYQVHIDIDGHDFLQEPQCTDYTLDFLNGINLPPMSWSKLFVRTKGEQIMVVDHLAVPEMGGHHYEVTFSLPKERKEAPQIFGSLVERLYGLTIPLPVDGEDYSWMHKQNSTLADGIIIRTSVGNAHDSIYEEHMQQIIRNLVLTDTEKAILAAYDPALVQTFPPQITVTSTALQQAEAFTPAKFLDIRKQLSDVDMFNLQGFINGNTNPETPWHYLLVLLSNERDNPRIGVPHIRLQAASPDREQLYRLIDQTFTHYQKLSGLGIDDAARQLRFELID